MVWLDTMTVAGQGIYLDIWKREKSRSFAGMELVSGILGDGIYEGEVLVELAPEHCEVTFIDQVLDPASLRDFLGRFDQDQLCLDLRRALGPLPDVEAPALPFFRHDAPGDHYRSSCQKAPVVQEKTALWRSDPPQQGCVSPG